MLPSEAGPRGRAQSDISSISSRRKSHLLRSTLSGSVDGIDKASIANSDGPTPGSRTPPFKRKGRLSTIGKIFKPWKWRKKKTSEKFKETSAVLERKISTRQSREELIRRGVLKEITEQGGDITVNYEISNGHTIVIGEEAIQEENNIKTTEDNSSISAKAPVLAPEEKKEGKKASSSHVKKVQGSKSTSSSSPSSSSSRPKTSKEPTLSKTGTGTPRDKKRAGKQVTVRTRANGDVSSASNTAADNSEMKAQNSKPEQPLHIIPEAEDRTQQNTVNVPPPPPAVPAPLPPTIPSLSPGSQPTGFSDTQDVPVSIEIGPSVPGMVSNDFVHTETEADSETPLSSTVLDNSLDIGDENTECSVIQEDQEKESSDLASPALTDELSETSNTPESESSRENHTSDSDSDGPILYTDDDDDDDDDASNESSLASKIRRRDTLAIKLGNRPSKKELEDKNILPRTSEEERQEIRHQIGTKLVRRLSQRPTSEELEQRNILRQKNEEEEQEAKRELKRSLSRKLSLRPTVAELQARRILRFNEYVEVSDSPDYDRRADKPWARLTPADKAAIRKELNEFKSTEMEVHEESRQFTRFHRP
ncbi:phosphatase and actin regulator 2 isoform X5 [Hemicordylus capensis]|uniref:phosphatase and actin regulator 2 isoform X5 n=1 Tax=Hemicordylus capensis TaxID=884348 RepID=UPI002302F6AE|nr:phosphatase and actin regulator 2 isoform X5 [Hemicordylus capensis]